MNGATQSYDLRFGFAWLLFAGVLAVHVADEATHGFVLLFNRNAQVIRAKFAIPIPTFTLGSFIATLGLSIVLLLCLTPLAFRGSPKLCRIAVPLSIVAGLANGVLHLCTSLYSSRWMPGSLSSPLVIVSALFLLFSALRPRHRANVQAAGL